MPAYSSRRHKVGGGAQEPTQRRSPLCPQQPFPKTAERTPQTGLSHLLLQFIQPLPHGDELRHLRLVVFLSEPPVSLMVHPLWLLGKRLRHVSAPSEPLPDSLRPAKSTVHLVLPLALVDEVVAMAAQEVAPRSVQNRNPAAAARSRTDKPRPLPSEVARRPGQGARAPLHLPILRLDRFGAGMSGSLAAVSRCLAPHSGWSRFLFLLATSAMRTNAPA